MVRRDVERNDYHRLQRRGGRRTRFPYPRELHQLPPFADWVLDEVRREEQRGVTVPALVLDTVRGPLPTVAAYKSNVCFWQSLQSFERRESTENS